jgi:pimeloyl-ACP methyl ester carboxylesterase
MTPVSRNRNRLTEKLGIEISHHSGAFLRPPFATADGFGFQFWRTRIVRCALAGPEAIKDVIAEIRSLTSRPFALNLWVSMEDAGARLSDEKAFHRSLAPLAGYLDALGAPRPAYKPYSSARFEDQAQLFDPCEPERYRQDVPDAQVHVLDAGHFALDTAADEIASLVQDFMGASS